MKSHVHHKRSKKGDRLHPTELSRSSSKPEVKVELPAAAPQDSALKILAGIVADLEKARDVHKSDLDGLIARLDQIHKLAVKATESTAPKQRAPHTVGGYLVV